jgi:hypothetical protein
MYFALGLAIRLDGRAGPASQHIQGTLRLAASLLGRLAEEGSVAMKFRVLAFAALAAMVTMPLGGYAKPPLTAHGATMSHPIVRSSPKPAKCPKQPCKKQRRAAPSHP